MYTESDPPASCSHEICIQKIIRSVQIGRSCSKGVYTLSIENPLSKATIPVMSKADVQEIWNTDKRIVTLAAQWFIEIRKGNKLAAARIRRESNQLKSRIREKYNIIID
jgi:hypothetical protein